MTGARTNPTPRYTARQQVDADPTSWAPYDEYYSQPIRPAGLSQRAAETLAERLNISGVDWIHDEDERPSSIRWPADHNDGHYPDDSDVWVRYPGPDDDRHDRDTWSWLTGYILSQCGTDEWYIAVDDDRVIEDEAQDWVPTCNRDSSEIQPRFEGEDAAAAGRLPRPRHTPGTTSERTPSP